MHRSGHGIDSLSARRRCIHAPETSPSPYGCSMLGTLYTAMTPDTYIGSGTIMLKLIGIHNGYGYST